MSQSTVFIVMRGEDHEGGSIDAVFATHARAVQHVKAAMLTRIHARHPGGWKVIDNLAGRPCTECGNITPPKPLPCRWECGIDWIGIEAWTVTP